MGASLGHAGQITKIIDEFFVNVLADAGKTEQMPALVNVEKGGYIEGGIKFPIALFADDYIIGDIKFGL